MGFFLNAFLMRSISHCRSNSGKFATYTVVRYQIMESIAETSMREIYNEKIREGIFNILQENPKSPKIRPIQSLIHAIISSSLLVN